MPLLWRICRSSRWLQPAAGGMCAGFDIVHTAEFQRSFVPLCDYIAQTEVHVPNFAAMVEGLQMSQFEDFSGIFYSLEPLLRVPFLRKVRAYFEHLACGVGPGAARARFSALVAGIQYVCNLIEDEVQCIA